MLVQMEAQGSFDLHWHGPFVWPGVESEDLPDLLDNADLAERCGIYLWTVDHAGGYLIYAAGITRRPFGRRFREHTKAYRSGVYTVFDIESLRNGVRNKVWRGFWFKKRSAEMQREYEAHANDIRKAAEDLLANYRIFVAPMPTTARVLERIEAAIMSNLCAADGPAAVIPDRGMALAPRRRDETLIRVHSFSTAVLHGLPSEFEA